MNRQSSTFTSTLVAAAVAVAFWRKASHCQATTKSHARWWNSLSRQEKRDYQKRWEEECEAAIAVWRSKRNGWPRRSLAARMPVQCRKQLPIHQ